MRYTRLLASVVLFVSILGCSNSSQPKSEPGQSDPSPETKRLPIEGGPDDPALVRYNKHFPVAVKLVLDQAEEIEVYSLEPHPKLKQGGEQRWDCKVLGKVQIKDADTRRKIVATLEKSMKNAHEGAKCFEPRHAVSAYHDGKRVEVVICFECGWMYASVSTEPSGPRLEMNRSGQDVFDAILKDAGIPLAFKRPD